MSVSVEAVIFVSGREAGSERPMQLGIDPLPIDAGGVQIAGGVFAISDLREALDRAETIQEEDTQ